MLIDYLRGLRQRRSMRVVLLSALALILVGSSLALAEEPDPEPIEYRPEDDAIVFSLPDEFGDFVDCSEAVIVVDGEELTIEGPEECLVASILGPNGQSNHGQVVRAYVHAIKDYEFDGPRGLLVRHVAKSDFGKKTDGEEVETLELSATESDHPGNGRGKGKKNKPTP